jgi:DNA modification methylase
MSSCKLTNKIYRGNCIDLILNLNNKFDVLLTDSPQYRLINENIKVEGRTDIIRKADFDLFDSYDDFISFTKNWIVRSTTKMKEDSSIWIFFAEHYSNDLINILNRYGWKHKDTFYWHKSNPVPRYRKTGFLSSVETALLFIRGKPTFNFLGQNDMHDFMETPICIGKERLKDNENKTLHPTQKPIKLIKHLLKITSNPGDWVLDPFTGTGTTNCACKMLKRNCIGIEKEPKYYDKAIKRLEDTQLDRNFERNGVSSWIMN